MVNNGCFPSSGVYKAAQVQGKHWRQMQMAKLVYQYYIESAKPCSVEFSKLMVQDNVTGFTRCKTSASNVGCH